METLRRERRKVGEKENLPRRGKKDLGEKIGKKSTISRETQGIFWEEGKGKRPSKGGEFEFGKKI